MNKKKMKKYFFIVITFLIVLFIAVGDSHAYTSSNAGKNDFDTSGGFYFEIKGGSNGNSRIHFQFKRLSGATSYNNMMSATSKWSVSTVSSNTTNKHNVQIVDTSINTKLDITDSYNVLSFRITYDMPAHYQYSSFSADSPSGMRFNMSEYSYDGSGANSAATNGYHSENTTRRTVNIQVNTGNTGLRTYGKYWYYNCTLSLNIAKADRVVTFTDGLGTILKTQNVVDSSYATAPTNPTRTGYTFIGWDKEYSVICSNTTVNAKWNINTYSIFYVLNGGSISNQPTSYTVVNAVNIPNPIRNGFEFLGWTGSNGTTPQKNITLSIGNTGNKEYTANWKIISPPVINTPSIDNSDQNEILPFISNGKLVIQLGDTFNAIKYATATDFVDGDLSSKIMVTSNAVPLSNDNIAIKNGTYNVNYSVTNSGGLTTTKDLTVIVNDPPELIVTERNVLQNKTVDIEELLKKATSNDKEDGDLSSKIKIIKINYSDSVVNNPTSFITDKVGKFTVTATVIDNYKKTVSKDFIVNVINDIYVASKEYKIATRFISKDFVNTLSNQSLWKSNIDYYNALNTSLNRTTPIISYTFDYNDIQQSKIYINSHKPSSESNKKYNEEFLQNRGN